MPVPVPENALQNAVQRQETKPPQARPPPALKEEGPVLVPVAAPLSPAHQGKHADEQGPSSKSEMAIHTPQQFGVDKCSAQELPIVEDRIKHVPDSDLAQKEFPRTAAIEVQLPQHVPARRTYGPPPLPVSLLPVHDSTAYIIDHMLYRPEGVGPDVKEMSQVQVY